MLKPAALALAATLTLLASCGGGSSGGGTGVTSQVIATPGTPNVEPITVDAGPATLALRSVNIPYVTLQICNASGDCQTLDHIEVDTGSSGLRILGSVLTIDLPVVLSGGKAVTECTQFADGSSYGPLAVANLAMPISGKQLTGLNIQVIGATNYPNVPSGCPGPAENTVEAFGANGVLGVGPFIQDCGPACADTVNFPTNWYYTCVDATPTGCQSASLPTDMQVSNPVALFTSDNNGVIVELPAVPSSGAGSIAGSLVFGIGTQSNNALGTATVLTADASFAYVQATYGTTTFQRAALDSGSNAVYFTDSTITGCTHAVGLYCPDSTLSLSATLKGMNGQTLGAPFTVANAETVLNANPTATVMPGLGGQIPSTLTDPHAIQFDLGLPFYFGRNVFTGIEGQPVSGSTGPLYAY